MQYVYAGLNLQIDQAVTSANFFKVWLAHIQGYCSYHNNSYNLELQMNELWTIVQLERQFTFEQCSYFVSKSVRANNNNNPVVL